MHSPVTIFAFPLLAIRIDEAANGGREELATVASKGCTSQGIAAAGGTPKNTMVYIPILYLLPRMRNAATSRL
jgi:hypothetical protein